MTTKKKRGRPPAVVDPQAVLVRNSIRELMAEGGGTQRELAQAAGLDESVVSRFMYDPRTIPQGLVDAAMNRWDVTEVYLRSGRERGTYWIDPAKAQAADIVRLLDELGTDRRDVTVHWDLNESDCDESLIRKELQVRFGSDSADDSAIVDRRIATECFYLHIALHDFKKPNTEALRMLHSTGILRLIGGAWPYSTLTLDEIGESCTRIINLVDGGMKVAVLSEKRLVRERAGLGKEFMEEFTNSKDTIVLTERAHVVRMDCRSDYRIGITEMRSTDEPMRKLEEVARQFGVYDYASPTTTQKFFNDCYAAAKKQRSRHYSPASSTAAS